MRADTMLVALIVAWTVVVASFASPTPPPESPSPKLLEGTSKIASTGITSQALHELMAREGIAAGMPMKTVVGKVRGLISQYSSPAMSGRYAMTYIRSHFREHEVEEYRRMNKLVVDRDSAVRSEQGQAGPQSARKYQIKVLKLNELDEGLKQMGLTFDMPPLEFWEALKTKSRYRISRQALAEKIKSLLIYKERAEHLSPAFREAFVSLVDFHPRDTSGKYEAHTEHDGEARGEKRAQAEYSFNDDHHHADHHQLQKRPRQENRHTSRGTSREINEDKRSPANFNLGRTLTRTRSINAIMSPRSSLSGEADKSEHHSKLQLQPLPSSWLLKRPRSVGMRFRKALPDRHRGRGGLRIASPSSTPGARNPTRRQNKSFSRVPSLRSNGEESGSESSRGYTATSESRGYTPSPIASKVDNLASPQMSEDAESSPHDSWHLSDAYMDNTSSSGSDSHYAPPINPVTGRHQVAGLRLRQN